MNWKFWKKEPEKPPIHIHDWITLRSPNHSGIPYHAANLTDDFPEFVDIFDGNRFIIKKNGKVYLQLQTYNLFDATCTTCDITSNTLTQEVARILDYHLSYTTRDKMEQKVSKANKEAKKILMKTLDKYDVESYRNFGSPGDE